MISLAMIVGDELRDSLSEVLLAERNQPVQTFFFDRPHEPLRVGIRIGGLIRRAYNAHANLAEPFAHRRGPLSIAIADQHIVLTQDPIPYYPPTASSSSQILRRAVVVVQHASYPLPSANGS